MKNYLLTLLLIFSTLPGNVTAENLELNGTSYQTNVLIKKSIGPGTTYMRLRLPDYPLNVNMLMVDLTNPYNKIETTIGSDKLGSTESLVSAAKRQTTNGHIALAGANANFWCTVEQPYATYIKGTPFGASLKNGKILTETNMSTDTWDGGAERTGVVSIDKDKKLWIESMGWQGTVTSAKWGTEKLEIAQVNKMCRDNQLVMYNSYYGTSRQFTDVTAGTQRTDVFLKLKDGENWSVNKDMKCEVKEIKKNTNGNVLGDYDLCISGTGVYKAKVDNLEVGDEITLNHAWYSFANNERPMLEQAVAGNAIVLKNGELTGRNTDEGYNSQVYSRTGYGMSQDGKTLYVIVIDKSIDPIYGISAGCGTNIMCEIAKHYGAWNLCTMDAGGSAQMFVKDAIVNKTTEGSPRAVANGWLIYSTAEPESEISRLEFADNELTVPIYSTFTPKIYGYDKYGNLIDEDVQGVVLSCLASIGTTDGNTFTAVGEETTGTLTASYNGIEVSKQISIKSAQLSIKIRNILIDNVVKYPIEVIADLNGNRYTYNPANIDWTVDDENIASIDKEGTLQGIKEGNTTIHARLKDFSDQATVTVEIASDKIIEQNYAGWTFSASGASNFEMSENGVLSFNYKGSRSPNIKITKDIKFYSLPNKVVMEFTPSIPVKHITCDFRTASMTAPEPLDIVHDYAANEKHIIEFPFDKDDMSSYPLTLQSVLFYIGTPAPTGEQNITFNSLRSEYDNNSYVETIDCEKSNSVYSIYPNLIEDGIVRIFTTEPEKTVVALYNMSGQLLLNKNVIISGNTFTLNVAGLSAGIYYLHLANETGNEVHKLIIK